MSKLLWLKAGFAEMVDFAFAVMNKFLFLMSFSFSFHQLNRPGFTNRALLFFTSFFLRLKRQLFFFYWYLFFFIVRLEWPNRNSSNFDWFIYFKYCLSKKNFCFDIYNRKLVDASRLIFFSHHKEHRVRWVLFRISILFSFSGGKRRLFCFFKSFVTLHCRRLSVK